MQSGWWWRDEQMFFVNNSCSLLLLFRPSLVRTRDMNPLFLMMVMAWQKIWCMATLHNFEKLLGYQLIRLQHRKILFQRSLSSQEIQCLEALFHYSNNNNIPFVEKPSNALGMPSAEIPNLTVVCVVRPFLHFLQQGTYPLVSKASDTWSKRAPDDQHCISWPRLHHSTQIKEEAESEICTTFALKDGVHFCCKWGQRTNAMKGNWVLGSESIRQSWYFASLPTLPPTLNYSRHIVLGLPARVRSSKDFTSPANSYASYNDEFDWN